MKKIFVFFFILISCISISRAQSPETEIINVYGRNITSLNGEWNIIIDPFDGGRTHFYKNIKPQNNNEFREFSFDGEQKLNVPGDFNSQMPELKYYEGTVWYARYFDKENLNPDKRTLLYFGGVSNIADVYLNGVKVGSHEGAFTPFSFDITDKLKPTDNFIAVAVNNKRNPDAVPGMLYDWWNYGGITRDVMLIEVPETYIEDYFIRLDPEDGETIIAEVELSNSSNPENIELSIPELGVKKNFMTDEKGRGEVKFKPANLEKWHPSNPKLYDVTFKSLNDSVTERIGFRTIETKGNKILLNGEPVFLCGVNIHEEIPQRKGRAYSEADAAMILHDVKELGCNFIRLAHYPQNEYIVRMAEEMGLLIWEEIPIWQNVDFKNEETRKKASSILEEMIMRDKNRASIILWSVANETWPSEGRNEMLAQLVEQVRNTDNTRLVTAAFNSPYFNEETQQFENRHDPIMEAIDVVGINKYLGWYEDWHKSPSETKWNVMHDKPLIFSEFGGEALYGNHDNKDAKWGWSEDFQNKIYEDNILMFENIENLTGLSPWVLYDFKSPVRYSPQQNYEFNRKGLISDRGEKKQSFHTLKKYYKEKLSR